MKGYKGFKKGLTCKGYKFQIGKTYEHDEEIKLCESRFHFCENPLDVLRYYGPADSEYAEVDADKVSEEKASDTKRICKKLTLSASLSLKAIIETGIKFIKSATSGDNSHSATSGESSHSATSGYSSHSATSGYNSHSATSGESSHSATSGESSHSATSGKYSIAAAIGSRAQAKSTIGNWIVLSEIDQNGKVLCVKTAKINGKTLKPDIWYKLEQGKFKEVKHE